MDLTARFEKMASGNIASMDNLGVGRRYLVTHAQQQETQYEPAILVTLRIDTTNDVRVFLPNFSRRCCGTAILNWLMLEPVLIIWCLTAAILTADRTN